VFMVVQATVAVLLSRLGAGEDIPLGAPVAGRADEALDDLVGFFVNTVVLRTDVSGDPSFGELLDRVREIDLTAFGHQDVPFERLVEILNPARSLSRHPLFQVMIAVQDTDGAVLTLGEGPGFAGTANPVPVTLTSAKFDLSFLLRELRGQAGITGALEYAADLFDEATARELTGRLARVLDTVTADPELRVSEVDASEESADCCIGPVQQHIAERVGWRRKILESFVDDRKGLDPAAGPNLDPFRRRQ